MNKKVISLVLALVMVLGTFTSVFATGKTEEPAKKEAKVEETKKEAPKDGEKVEKVVGKDNKIQYIIDKKFVQGYEDGSMGYDKNITRAEITRLLVLANGNEDLAKSLQGSMKLYTDVDTKHWANGVISVGTTRPSDANKIAMLAGYPDKSFKPDRNVTYAELAKMLVVLVKKDLTEDMVKNAKWATSWMLWAKELGILEDVDVKDSNAFATRADAFTMVYNALYAMKYFKRVPANETMGILSQLKNNELTLNQGEKAKTFKLTNSTVFFLYNQGNTLDVNANTRKGVRTYRDQLVQVSAINNPKYYYGSLVRVIADKDGNVTHILELGNPRFLAIGHKGTETWQHTNIKDSIIDPNQRWRDVADATVETSYTGYLNELFDRDRELTKSDCIAAKINYKNGDAKSIDFQKGMFYRKPTNETGSERNKNNFEPTIRGGLTDKFNVRLTSKTRYFVADVYQNQLTEVKDVDEAIRILGNTTASNWFFDVYAGYNTFSDREKHETAGNTNLKGYNEATVVVFNSVQKSNNAAQLLRVKNETNSKYGITFENTKGEVVDFNVETYRNYFPFNFNTRNDSAKLDVVEYSVNNAYGIEAEMKIDHSKTSRYPIVKVVDIDGRWIQVEDANRSSASLYLDTDADIFLEGQLKVGKLIQFHTLTDNMLTYKDKDNKVFNHKVNETNVVDIVSVMPDRYEGGMKGTLDGVTESNLWNQVAGKVLHVNDVTEYGAQYHKVIVNVDRSLYDGEAFYNRDFFKLNNTEALRLKKWLAEGNTDKYFRFKIDLTGRHDRIEMYDIEVLVGNDKTKEENWVKLNMIDKYAPTEATDAAKVYMAAVDAYNKKAPVTEANHAELQKLLNDVKAAQDNLTSKDAKNLPFKYLDASKPLGLALDVPTEQGKISTAKDNAEARKALKEAIDAAEAIVKDVTASADGTDVETSKKWALQSDITTFKGAIATAKGVANDMSKVKADLDGAKTTLKGAQTTFAGQIKIGTKAN